MTAFRLLLTLTSEATKLLEPATTSTMAVSGGAIRKRDPKRPQQQQQLGGSKKASEPDTGGSDGGGGTSDGFLPVLLIGLAVVAGVAYATGTLGKAADYCEDLA